jgi:predicted phosphodiesterase
MSSFCWWFSVALLSIILVECRGFMPPNAASRPSQGFFQGADASVSVLRARASAADGVTHLSTIERVLCISDLHTDHMVNMKWLENRTSLHDDLGETDLIVVAGDISHDLETFERSLLFLTETGAQVFFVPGNHEAWLASSELEDGSSVDKLDLIYQACERLGVLTGCTLVGGTDDKPYPLWIAPLQSWYDGSLSLENCEDLCDDFGKWPWVDFIRCRWPGFLPMGGREKKIPAGLTQFFAKRNKVILEQVEASTSVWDSNAVKIQGHAVMTVSHFLPNKQSLPDWKDLSSPHFLRDQWLGHGAGHMSAKFAKVAGTELIDKQIRDELHLPKDTRQIHVFGHSHRPKDFEYDNVRYIHNPLGKPREREIFMVAPDVDLQLVWDTRKGEVPGETVIRYWEEKGGGLDALILRMSKSRRPSRYKHAKVKRDAAHKPQLKEQRNQGRDHQ